MFATIQIGCEYCFVQRVLATPFEAQHLRQRPMGLEPLGMGGNGGTQAALRPGGIVLGGADRGEAVPGVEWIFRGARGPLARRVSHLQGLEP